MTERDAVVSLLLVAVLAWLLPLVARTVRERTAPEAAVVWSREAHGRHGDADLVWAPASEIPDAKARDGRHVDSRGMPTGPIEGWRGLLLGNRLDLNHATAEDLRALPGVGPATADAILDDRRRNGPYLSVTQLQRVRGIGPKTMQRLRQLLTVRSPPDRPP